jgi:dolichol-phosphate mannosyltransferase
MTTPGPRVHIVLPAYNEEAAIGRVLDRIEEALQAADIGHTVLVVDDGSADGTARVVQERAARRPGVRLQRHPANLGLGPTLRDGLLVAAVAAADADVVVTMDADDTQPPELIPAMMRRIADGADVVIASRYQAGARTLGVPLHRRALSRLGSLLFQFVLPIPGVRDFTCGYRAYRASVLKAAIQAHGDRFVDQQGFQSMVDVLLKLRGRGLTFAEVPLVLRYDAKSGASKMKVAATVGRTLLLVGQRRFLDGRRRG